MNKILITTRGFFPFKLNKLYYFSLRRIYKKKCLAKDYLEDFIGVNPAAIC